MALNKAYTQYQENSIMTSNPEELTLMLYNGLIKFIMKAQKAINENDIESAHNNIVKAQNIIQEFESTIDVKYEISKNLLLLYDYMKNRLMEANLKKDGEILEEVLEFAKELRNTWEQAMKIYKVQGKAKV